MINALHGVNLGGWLVLERWIAPSLFQGTSANDEYSLCEVLSADEVTKRLTKHRDTFITEKHVEQVAKLGLTLLRLPVGYWLFGDTPPFVDGADTYVDRVFKWADRYGLKVILDFHAAPGSQNGWDHSGRSGAIRWHEASHVAASLAFVDRLCKRYGQERALIGIEPLNEPHWDVDLSTLVEYYRKSAEIIQNHCHKDVSIIVSDAFRPEKMSKALRRAGVDAVLDIHLYQLFTPEDRALDLNGHLNKTNNDWSKLLRNLSKHHSLLVGEWSSAMSELYNDMGERQHKYDQSAYETYAHEQQRVFTKQHVSWTYWTARTEDGGVWSLLDRPELLL